MAEEVLPVGTVVFVEEPKIYRYQDPFFVSVSRYRTGTTILEGVIKGYVENPRGVKVYLVQTEEGVSEHLPEEVYVDKELLKNEMLEHLAQREMESVECITDSFAEEREAINSK